MKRAWLTCAAIAAASCSTANSGQRLTEKAFDVAKKRCGATEAHLFDFDGGQAIGLKGTASDTSTRITQAQCLRSHLKDTDVRLIEFISEPPPESTVR